MGNLAYNGIQEKCVVWVLYKAELWWVIVLESSALRDIVARACAFLSHFSTTMNSDTDETFKKGVDYRLAGNEAFKKADYPEGEHGSSRIHEKSVHNNPFQHSRITITPCFTCVHWVAPILLPSSRRRPMRNLSRFTTI